MASRVLHRDEEVDGETVLMCAVRSKPAARGPACFTVDIARVWMCSVSANFYPLIRPGQAAEGKGPSPRLESERDFLF